MNISFSPMSTPASTSFKSNIPKYTNSSFDIEGKADDEVVANCNWGSNYDYPITAGQVRASLAQQALNPDSVADLYKCSCKESPEEYYKRKLYSTEWTT